MVRTAQAIWEGRTHSGRGLLRLGSGAFEGPFASESGTGDHESQANPEELLAAAQATAYSTEISSLLERNGHPAVHINTYARVHIERSPNRTIITAVDIEVEAKVPGLSETAFRELAEQAQRDSSVLHALEAVPCRLRTRLVS